MNRSARKLHIVDFLKDAQHLHLRRTDYRHTDFDPPHTHDFAEFFWIERGSGRHWINGQRRGLDRGDLVLVRPADRHAFAARDRAGFTLVNIAFRASALSKLKQRLAPQVSPWPWDGEDLPTRLRLSPGDLHWLAQLVLRLEQSRATPLDLEFCLLCVIQLSQSGPAPLRDSPLPHWLNKALGAMAQPGHLAGGVRELARLALRSHEHVNRVVRRHTGRTTTDLLNGLRMDHAARELRMTDRSIRDIALECGLTNLGHFYKLFHARFTATPRQYRLRQNAVVRPRPARLR